MRRWPRLRISLVLLGLVGGIAVSGCDSGSRRRVVLEANPGADLAGIWTGTFSDQFGDYTVAVEIFADALVPAGTPGRAFISWGAESMGLLIANGEFVEVGPGHYQFEYQTTDPLDGTPRDVVSGDLFFMAGDLVEGSFATTSGTFGEFSFGLTSGFDPSFIEGHYAMSFSDAATRDLFYLGEVVYDASADVLPGLTSYLTDDLEGEIDPDANVWPITDGYLTLLDEEVGYFEGEFFFEDPQDTIALGGYLGWDLGVFAGIFEDIQGPGLFSFIPIGSP